MNLQEQYKLEFPKRKPLNNKGEATKLFEEWCETQKSEFLQMLHKREEEETLKLKEWYKEEQKFYKKKVKANKKAKPDPSLAEIQEMSNPKRVNKFLEG